MAALEQNYLTASDGYSLFYRRSIPKHTQAHIIMIHGYGEHTGRYQHVMQHLADKGFACFAPDLRGHGNSAKRLGYIKSIDRIIQDIYELKEFIKRDNSARTIFLFGHSMGALLALNYLIVHPNEIRGAALIAPMIIIPDYISPLLKTLTGLISALFPILPIQDFDTAKTTRDPEIIAAADKDPLCYHGKIRARTGAEMMKSMEYVNAHLDSVTTPVLIMQGSEDKILPPESSGKVYRMVSSQDKTLKIFAGLYHELFNEPEKEAVFKYITDWIESKLKSSDHRPNRGSEGEHPKGVQGGFF
ncbi:MAG: lysophospholipase [Spirochaetales bacterium]|nr:lysophospholipase [Spirochaetales bacterium]